MNRYVHISLEDPFAHELWILHPPQVIANSVYRHPTRKSEKINTGGQAVKTGSVTGKREFNCSRKYGSWL